MATLEKRTTQPKIFITQHEKVLLCHRINHDCLPDFTQTIIFPLYNIYPDMGFPSPTVNSGGGKSKGEDVPAVAMVTVLIWCTMHSM